MMLLHPQWSHCGFRGMLKNFYYEEVIGMFFFNSKKTEENISESFQAYIIFFIQDVFLKIQSISLNMAFSIVLS